mgnify:FL=1
MNDEPNFVKSVNHKADKYYWQLIWENFKSGHRKAFEIIYNEFVDVMFSYGSRITKDRDMLEDCIHDVFISLYQYGSELRKPESLEFYLLKSLKHTIFRKLKESDRYLNDQKINETFDLKFSVENTDSTNISDEQTKKLQKEIQKLDSKKRELLFLKFNSGLTYKEIGKLLDLNPDAVKKQVYRLLKFMRDRLGDTFLELFLIFKKDMIF